MNNREMDYKAVIEGFRSGEIDKKLWTVVFDNDGGYWQYNGELPEEQVEAMQEAMEEKYGSPGGYCDIVDLALAAGIPSEWC